MLDLRTTQDTIANEERGRREVIRDERKQPYINPSTGKECTALIVGTYSNRYRSKVRELNEAAAREGGEQTPEQRDAITREGFGACVLEWDFSLDGAMADPATVFAMRPHIYDQIVGYATDHAGFFVAPSAS